MDESIEWKEARVGNTGSDHEEEEKIDAETDELVNSEDETPLRDTGRHIKKTFSQNQINLSLRRDITALADPNLHKLKPSYFLDDQAESFCNWLENAIVAISPAADLILFSSQTPERIIFFAKLRKTPINQYTTSPLSIPFDHDEQVTSLLCLPIMSTQRTSLGLVDWTVLVIGFSSGYIKFYTEQSICLMNLKFCDEPIKSIKCQTLKCNPNGRSDVHFANLTDELFITYKSLSILIDGLTLNENLRLAKGEVIKNGPIYEPAYNLNNLPSILHCQKWKLEEFRGSNICDGEILGIRRTTTFDSLKSDSINFEHLQAKTSARSFAFAGRDPFISCCKETRETSNHSYTEVIGSLLSIWGRKPPPSQTQITEITASSSICLFDKERRTRSTVASPDRRLIATTDDFGRVLLVDVTNWLVVRMWKGYRSAQCGWIEVKRNPDQRESPHALFLVIYAPKRGLLEIWSIQRGPRVAAFNVGKSCRLLYTNYKMFNMRADRANKSSSTIEQAYTSHCYLLDAKSENIFSIELPYTFSLYKFGDLKSRDHLLIGELMTAIHQNAEVSIISEILHRISLAESLQTCVRKITQTLQPDKIITLMENLINNRMKNYDNHSGQPINADDLSIIELSKRLIRLCNTFIELSSQVPNDFSLPDVNQRLIDRYEEHPQEIDEFAQQLGWPASEVLRCLSLMALERSFQFEPITNPWPNLGEPLSWVEFISCFDLDGFKPKNRNGQSAEFPQKAANQLVCLKKFHGKFLNDDKVLKTALFMYNRSSEDFYQSIIKPTQILTCPVNKDDFLDPTSRLVLLLKFWLSTKLCLHWKMWAYLRNQIRERSNELRRIAVSQGDDKILVETWKYLYELIIESDNVFAALVATSSLKSVTLGVIRDQSQDQTEAQPESKEDQSLDAQDWECLCIDAERMSLLSQQLESVFLLSLLLKYSHEMGHLVDSFQYIVPRISVASILRHGHTIVSELVAQWVVQSCVNINVIVEPYGSSDADETAILTLASSIKTGCKLYASKPIEQSSEDSAKELIHHTRTSYPCSLDSDILLLYIVWEYCKQWISKQVVTNKVDHLQKAYDCLSVIGCVALRHKLASVIYKTFFQRTLERLVVLVERNSAILTTKNSKLRDKFARKELNMSEESLEGFIQFCCNISDFLLQTKREMTNQDTNGIDAMHQSKLLRIDKWWAVAYNNRNSYMELIASSPKRSSMMAVKSLIETVLSVDDLLGLNYLLELNSLSNLMSLILRLRIVKAHPITLIGEESRQVLQLNLQQAGTSGSGLAESINQSCSLNELRQRFARKCILNLVNKIDDSKNEFSSDEESDHDEGKEQSTATNTGSAKRSGQRPSRKYSSSKVCDELEVTSNKDESHESMVIFACLLTLANEWQLDLDQLRLELVFELFRCNHDKVGAQMATRVKEQDMLASGLLKIASQRILVLLGLSPHVSGTKWQTRIDKWALVKPNVASWLKSVQFEEVKREIAGLSFSNCSRAIDSNNPFRLQPHVLKALRHRTKLMLETATNHLDGQASRLAYDLLHFLNSQSITELHQQEAGLSH